MNEELRIIFIGTPDFAVESLKALLQAKKKVVAVITAPDRKAGRGRKLTSSAVKACALENNLPVLQPTNLKNKDFLNELETFRADLQIVVAFRMLPELVWNMPNLGTFNLHASLLPHYRGAAPINWAIINGEKKTGVSTFFLKHKIDTGDILFQNGIEIEPDDNAGILHDKLMNIGADLVVKTVIAIEQNNYQQLPQIVTESKEAPKLTKENTQIDFTAKPEQIVRLIKGLSPYPGAWCTFVNKEADTNLNVKIYDAQVFQSVEGALTLTSGKLLVDSGKILIGTANTPLEITDLKVEGKRRLKAKELLNGFDLSGFEIG